MMGIFGLEFRNRAFQFSGLLAGVLWAFGRIRMLFSFFFVIDLLIVIFRYFVSLLMETVVHSNL